MDKVQKKLKKLQLALVFATFVFLIILATMFIIFAGAYLLQQLGFSVMDEEARIPLFSFAVVSLIVGTILALLFSSRPLKPLRKVGEAADKIASGDYSTRIHLTGADELVQLSNQFNHMAEELGSVEMLRNDFVNNFSHEFKTPIVSIRGFAKMLKRDDLTAEERGEYLDIIINESERLAELSTNVLNLSKIEQQTILTDKKTYNVSEQIRLVIAMLHSKWKDKNITFDFDCGEIEIYANEELMKQVWINLLDNAIKFSPDGETIKIRIVKKVDGLLFTIKDNGQGMSEETVSHIFDKFYQGDQSHTNIGNGLGLPIAKRIIDLHNGHISVYSDKNNGTSFHLDLPNL